MAAVSLVPTTTDRPEVSPRAAARADATGELTAKGERSKAKFEAGVRKMARAAGRDRRRTRGLLVGADAERLTDDILRPYFQRDEHGRLDGRGIVIDPYGSIELPRGIPADEETQLRGILETAAGKQAAYRLAGEKLVSTTAAARWRFTRLGELLLTAGGMPEAPAWMVRIAERANHNVLTDEKVGVEPWMPVLANIIAPLNVYRRESPSAAKLTHKARRELVEHVLGALAASVVKVPAQFTRADPIRLDAAAEALMEKPTSGRPLEAWGLARRFAEVFDVPMPEQSDATRDRSGRPRNATHAPRKVKRRRGVTRH
ncbi:MAG: hypothetical protein WKG00_17825 [Polyangiaceae bacterium]